MCAVAGFNLVEEGRIFYKANIAGNCVAQALLPPPNPQVHMPRSFARTSIDCMPVLLKRTAATNKKWLYGVLQPQLPA